MVFDEHLRIANLYDEGLQRVQKRREHWLEKFDLVKNHLNKLATHLNQNSLYKQGFFVDTLFAYNDNFKGTCNRIPSLTFRTGEMPMLVTFRNAMGEKKAYNEEGFSISFNPTITGLIIVNLQPHHSDLDAEAPSPITLAIIEEPSRITDEIIDEIILKGMKAAYYSSFTGMGELPEDAEQVENAVTKRNPIGFKRHDTTQKTEPIHNNIAASNGDSSMQG
jgi:hypothetical protein